MPTIAENIAMVKAKIAETRPGAELIAVSKNHDAAKVRAALGAGQYIFGENRVQEAAEKFTELRNEFPSLKLHLIGPLQTNKVKDALKLFDVIQTIDREKLARVIAKELGDARGQQAEDFSRREALGSLRAAAAQRRSEIKDFFIQVNIGEEAQKAGIAPKETEGFYKFCTQDLKLNITGLMCIPPVDEPAFMYFALLKNIALKLETQNSKLKLSMGMSADYEEALEMGADYIRVGTGIFGERLPDDNIA